MQRAKRTSNTRPGLLVTAFLALALVAAATSLAQYALDANMRVGSGGYNTTRASSSMVRSRYTVGSSRPIYTVNGAGQMVYNPNNAFNPNSSYTATGYTSRHSHGAMQHRRFRYGGGY